MPHAQPDRSDEFSIETSLCLAAWSQKAPSSSGIYILVRTVIDLVTICPDLHWSKSYVHNCSCAEKRLIKVVTQMVLQTCDAGDLPHDAGSLGCSSRKAVAPCWQANHWICSIRKMRILSPSTLDCWSCVLLGNPHSSVSDLPLNGTPPPGLGMCKRMEKVRQIGPPMTALIRP